MSAAHELVDVLDDTGRVVGVTTRGDVRARRLPHRCVYVLVFNDLGEIFIHQRTAGKDVYPSYWDMTVGGVVASGESFDQAARREGQEELGVALEPEFLFPFQYPSAMHGTAFAQVYRVRHNGPFQLQPEEIVQGGFVALLAKRAPARPANPSARMGWQCSKPIRQLTRNEPR